MFTTTCLNKISQLSFPEANQVYYFDICTQDEPSSMCRHIAVLPVGPFLFIQPIANPNSNSFPRFLALRFHFVLLIISTKRHTVRFYTL